MLFQAESDVLAHRHVRPQRVGLKHQARRRACHGGRLRHVVAADQDTPASGSGPNPATARNSVDLPEPDGPRKVNSSPGSIARLTPFNTSVSRNERLRFSMVTLTAAPVDLGYHDSDSRRRSLLRACARFPYAR